MSQELNVRGEREGEGQWAAIRARHITVALRSCTLSGSYIPLGVKGQMAAEMASTVDLHLH